MKKTTLKDHKKSPRRQVSKEESPVFPWEYFMLVYKSTRLIESTSSCYLSILQFDLTAYFIISKMAEDRNSILWRILQQPKNSIHWRNLTCQKRAQVRKNSIHLPRPSRRTHVKIKLFITLPKSYTKIFLSHVLEK